MATILERVRKNGESTWKVAIRRECRPHFYLTFDNFDAACDWVEKNEKKYILNPEEYFAWRDDLMNLMIRKQVKSWKHVVRAKPKR
jgi:hypothetical protein